MSQLMNIPSIENFRESMLEKEVHLKNKPSTYQIHKTGFVKGLKLKEDLFGELKIIGKAILSGEYTYFEYSGKLYAKCINHTPLLIYEKGKFLNLNKQLTLWNTPK